MTCCERWRLATKVTLEEPESGLCALCVHHCLLLVICLSSVSAVVETMPEAEGYRDHLTIAERVVTVLFTIEILVRHWIAQDRCSYFRSCQNVVDMIATLPWYIEHLLFS